MPIWSQRFSNVSQLTFPQRGGAGNEHRDKFGGHSKDPSKETVGDKVKHLLHLDGKKREGSPLQHEEKP
jgi:hypothetical protein